MARKFTSAFTDATNPLNKASRDMVVEHYKALGFTVIGTGSRAVALAHPKQPERVVRVAVYDGMDPEVGGEPIDGWLSYLQAFRRSTSKHMPKVDEVVLYRECYVAFTERLRELPYSQYVDSGLYAAWNYDDNAKLKGTLRRHVERIASFIEPDADDYDDAMQLDLHGGNFMQRADGTIVATDPYFIPN